MVKRQKRVRERKENDLNRLKEVCFFRRLLKTRVAALGGIHHLATDLGPFLSAVCRYLAEEKFSVRQRNGRRTQRYLVLKTLMVRRRQKGKYIKKCYCTFGRKVSSVHIFGCDIIRGLGRIILAE